MKKESLRIALIQMSCKKDPAANLRKAISEAKIAAAKGAKIICFQELFHTLYFCQTENTEFFDWAEKLKSSFIEELSKVARLTRAVIIAPFFEKAAKGVYYNSAVVFDADGKIAGHYRKMHIPDDPGFYEKFYFVPGDLGFKAIKTRYATIGVLICWDQWFPEAARLTALKGADILFYPTAIGWKPAKTDEAKAYHASWETIQRSHAIANGVFVAAVNRVGKEGDFKFWGQSFVADPFGKIAYRASASNDEIVIEDLDLSQVEQTRREWPFLRDRRIDAYSGILSRTS